MIPVIDASCVGVNDVGNLFVVEDVRPGAPVIDGIEERQNWSHVFWIDAIDTNGHDFESDGNNNNLKIRNLLYKLSFPWVA